MGAASQEVVKVAVVGKVEEAREVEAMVGAGVGAKVVPE